MRIAVFSDAHGNVSYLEHCLDSMSSHGVDQFVFLGDAVGYFPTGLKAYEMIRDKGSQMLLGNHEAMLSGILPVPEESKEVYQFPLLEITQEKIKELRGLLPYYRLTVGELSLLFVHGSPWDPLSGYLYEDSPLLDAIPQKFDFIFAGHTHRPFIKRIGSSTFVNVGSCGLPRDVGNFPSYSIFDTAKGDVEIIREIIEEGEVENIISSHILSESVINCLKRGTRKEVEA